MDTTDVFLKRISVDDDLKKPINALISFSKPETGQRLCLLAKNLIRSRASQSSIVALHLISEKDAQEIGDLERYKNDLFRDILDICEENDISIRTFIKISDDYVSDILETEKTYNCNFLLIGIGRQVFNTMLWEKYLNLNNEEGTYFVALEEPKDETERKRNKTLTNISSLLIRNKETTGVFIDNDFTDVNKVFIPILDKTDIYIFPFINRLSFREKTSVMIWDAIGIIEANAEMKKLYQHLNKRTNGRLKAWDNNEKIDYSFISEQDLIIIGLNGWSKLINSAIPWVHSLPSTLIIKETEKEG